MYTNPFHKKRYDKNEWNIGFGCERHHIFATINEKCNFNQEINYFGASFLIYAWN